MFKAVKEKKEELRKLRFSLAQGQHKDTSQIKKIKKEIARLLTREKK